MDTIDRILEQKNEQIKQLEEENKNLRDYADNLDSENDNQAIEIEELKKENKKLKEDNRFLTKISKEYMKKENIIQVTEFTELYKNDLEEENKKLNIKVASLEWEIKWLNYTIEKLKEENQTLELWLDNKEKVNKKLREELSAYDREYFDEDKKAKNIFMEEDTLQELRDIWELEDDELIYEEWLYD